mgnify:CR=1 FL=1
MEKSLLETLIQYKDTKVQSSFNVQTGLAQVVITAPISFIKPDDLVKIMTEVNDLKELNSIEDELHSIEQRKKKLIIEQNTIIHKYRK